MFSVMRYLRDSMPSDLDQTARNVAWVIGAHCDRNGCASVGIRQLSKLAGPCPETCSRAIRRLEDAGVLRVERSARRRSVYRFPVTDSYRAAVPPPPAGDDPRGVFLPGTGWIATA